MTRSRRPPHLPTYRARAQDFWNTPLATRGATTYTRVNLTALTNPCFGAWPGGGDCAYYEATAQDPLVSLFYLGASTMYNKLASRAWANWGNPPAIEMQIRALASQTWNGKPYNEYSKGDVSGGPPVGVRSRFAPPWRLTAHVPRGAHPDPHADGLMSVRQPDGAVLETMGTVILANGDLVTISAGFINPAHLLDGANMGRRASLLPAYAGIVRQGEMTAQRLPHVLALNFGPEAILAQNPVYPAFGLDSSTVYTGGPGTALPMGGMLAIPPHIPLASAGITTTAGLTIATALQRYGGVLGDTATQGMWGICAQAYATDIPPWSGPLAHDLGSIRDLCQRVNCADFPVRV